MIRQHDARHPSVSLKRSQGWLDHLVAAWRGHDQAVMRATYPYCYLADLRRRADAMPPDAASAGRPATALVTVL